MEIPFKSYFKDKMLAGIKICTSRTKQYGKVGDTFEVFGATFEIIMVNKCYLAAVAHELYVMEGFDSPEQFRRGWEMIHPRRGYIGNDMVFVHTFKKMNKEEGK